MPDDRPRGRGRRLALLSARLIQGVVGLSTLTRVATGCGTMTGAAVGAGAGVGAAAGAIYDVTRHNR